MDTTIATIPTDDKAEKKRNKKLIKQVDAAPKKTPEEKRIEKMVKTLEGIYTKFKNDYPFRIIRSEVALRSFIDEAISAGVLALDIETSGLNPFSDTIVGFCLDFGSMFPAYVPTGHTNEHGEPLPDQISAEAVVTEIKRAEQAGAKLILHNAKFDLKFIRQKFGVRLDPYWDTYIASCVLNENEPHGLKALYVKYCDTMAEADTFSDLFEGIPFNFIKPEYGGQYGAKDAKMTLELYHFQAKYLNESAREDLLSCYHVFRNLEMPLISLLIETELLGITIDKPFAKGLELVYKEKLVEAESRCFRYVAQFSKQIAELPEEKRSKLGDPINLSSPLQLGIFIYDVLGLRNSDGSRSTAEGVLLEFASAGKSEQFFKDLLEVRSLNKLLGTYIEKMPSVVAEQTGRLHGSFNQYGAKTGRFSSSEPNLQNIPSHNKDIRKMFVAADDCVFVSADYSQQEPRILAHVANDEQMKEAYRQNRDLYASVASVVYNVQYDECKEFRPDGSKNPEGKKRRDSMKSVVLGLMYGRGAAAIAEQLNISKESAQSIINTFFDGFPNVRDFVQNTKSFAKSNGYVKTVWGRKRRLEEFSLPPFEFQLTSGEPMNKEAAQYYAFKFRNAYYKDLDRLKAEAYREGIRVIDNRGKIAEAERQAVNSIIQGTAADITKSAMIAIGQDPLLNELGAKIVLTVHDEIIVEVAESQALIALDRMQKLMIEAAADRVSVPMRVDAEITRRWYGEDVTEELKALYGLEKSPL